MNLDWSQPSIPFTNNWSRHGHVTSPWPMRSKQMPLEIFYFFFFGQNFFVLVLNKKNHRKKKPLCPLLFSTKFQSWSKFLSFIEKQGRECTFMFFNKRISSTGGATKHRGIINMPTPYIFLSIVSTMKTLLICL